MRITARISAATAVSLLAAVLLWSPAPAMASEQGPDVAQRIDPDEWEVVPAADVYVLGEVHDNPVHHLNQARALTEFGAKALVFEMLSDAQARGIPDAIRGDAKALAEHLQWEASGWPDFEMYFPIFAAGRALPIFGAAVPRQVLDRAIGEGAEAAMGDAAPLFGLSDSLDDGEQALREAGQIAAHCDAIGPQVARAMVAAQRVRDAWLARAALAAVAETGGPVVVITGNGHARRDWGVPALLEQAAPGMRVISVGQLEAIPESPPPYDFWVLTDPAERSDPCEGLRAAPSGD